MPIVRIDIQSGKTTEYKRTLLHGVRDAIAAELGVAHDRVMQRIVETPREDIDATEVRSDRLTIIEITMLPRSPELKEALYRAIASRLGVEPGIPQHDLVVLVNDPAAECFFINGRMQCEGSGSAEEPPPLGDEPEESQLEGPAEEIAPELAQDSTPDLADESALEATEDAQL